MGCSSASKLESKSVNCEQFSTSKNLFEGPYTLNQMEKKHSTLNIRWVEMKTKYEKGSSFYSEFTSTTNATILVKNNCIVGRIITHQI